MDSILNAVLFVLIGLEMLLPFDASNLVPAVLAIPIVLLARFVSVALPTWVVPFLHALFDRRTANVLAWGGLRDGITVGLALALPQIPPTGRPGSR